MTEAAFSALSAFPARSPPPGRNMQNALLLVARSLKWLFCKGKETESVSSDTAAVI
jgi:hypothetical protein